VEQIEACHRRGIRAPIYTTVQWDQFTADEHRDWLLVDEEGKPYGNAPLEAGFYRRLDVSHPGFVDFLQNHVRELFETMPVDGLWFDIVVPHFSYARHWLDGMARAGLNVHDVRDRTRFAREVIDRFQHEMTRFVEGLPQYTADCTIFYNSGHVGVRHRESRPAFTHFELESLPAGGWGYLHFPTTQRYARGLGKPTLGMTGKFHSTWGDFHGYKNEATLEFEVFTMLALGAATCIGDQLRPRGVLDTETYRLVGEVFGQVEAKEPWCVGATPVTDIAVLHPEEYSTSEGAFTEHQNGRTDFGAVRMLQELGCQFDLVSSDRDLSGYRLVILPDSIPVDEQLASTLAGVVDGGGSLLLSHRSGLTPNGDRFVHPWFGVERVGESAFEPDFVRPGEQLRADLADAAYVMSQRALEVSPLPGTEVLAGAERPYFNRTWEHFCSHQYAPSTGEVVYPAVTRRGPVAYLAHPVFRMYDHEAPRWVKRLVRNAVDLLVPGRLLEHDGPSTVVATVNEQADLERYVIHLLHYIPEPRAAAFDVFEDVIPLHDLTLTLRLPRQVTDAVLVPQNEPLELRRADGAVTVTVPTVHGHQMIALSYLSADQPAS
ncbi:MAG: beta-galactosidase trimerization domain-containing protein, partial [Dermatophilaceae bacterium]